jgi:hypothetical protein
MKASTVLEYIEDVVMEWEALGLALQLPYKVVEEIKMDKDDMESKRKELIRRWMISPELCGPACWWLLVKALEADTVKMNALAARIKGELGIIQYQYLLITDRDKYNYVVIVVQYPTVICLVSLFLIFESITS